MNWALTILIGLITAVAGCLGTGYLGSLCVSWHRISGREGGSGYFVIFMGLLGVVLGLVVGLVCARVVGGWPGGSFLKGLGLALGSTVVLFLASVVVAYLAAEFPPTIDGKELMVETEVRYPAGVSVPPSQGDQWKWHATVTADYGKRRQIMSRLSLAQRRKEEGRWIVPVDLELDTVVPQKTIGVVDGGPALQYVSIEVPGRPKSVTDDWSPWRPATFRGDLQPIGAGEAVEVRYRVRHRKS
jgi:hypothetical protein